MSRPLLHSTTCLITVLLLAGSRAAAPQVNVNLQQKIDEVVRPLVEANDIPGMAIAISVNGKRFYYNYGRIYCRGSSCYRAHTV
jgi:CubicO group peptidase (beta-lactamase class C family)